ncbi:hypothetical protein CFRA_10385 [Corynebacterium frankenforstense DSM 45800]|uniref:Uncharacterized protein n=1 Tax=Corynebacterium frankenforstense DSM 45800 TaxID=1437875 RepID=A0A1L7CUL0_9CORY|nr:hypothetical protein [Corynebacterium frankenforstense]APT89566.1 hypothetical protein CFRA_10385 [Corynebacterium frankenforstense DSM 45800]
MANEPQIDNTFTGDDGKATEAWTNLQNWNFLSSGWGEGDDHQDTVISALLNTFGGVFADTAEAISKLFGLFR